MSQENPPYHSCKSVINPNSYFFTISISLSQPKIRLRIPKLLAKIMHKRDSNGAKNPDHTKDEKNKKWAKVTSIIFSVFNSKKSSKVSRNDHHDEVGLAEAEIVTRVESDDQPKNKSSLSKSYSFKKLLEIEDDQDQQKRINPNMDNNKAQKSFDVSLSFSRLFHGSSRSCNFTKGKSSKVDTNSGNIAGSGCRKNNSQNSANSPTSTVGRIANTMIGKRARTHSLPRVPSVGNSSDHLPRVASRILTTRGKLKMGQSLTRMASRRMHGRTSVSEDRGDGGEELCKKRILMGEKCKPLSYSGTLQYDKDGVLLPDVIP